MVTEMSSLNIVPCHRKGGSGEFHLPHLTKAFKIKITPNYLTIFLVYLQNTLNLSIKRRHLFPALLQGESSVLFWPTGILQ
jgi:hypothetical protein